MFKTNYYNNNNNNNTLIINFINTFWKILTC